MPHNDHIFRHGIVPVTMVPTPGRLREMDQRASEGLNVVDGGTYAPTERIGIGGAGVRLGATAVLHDVRTGPKGGGLILTGSDAPVFATPRTRSLLVNLFNTKDFSTPQFASDFIPNEDPYGIKHIAQSGSIDQIYFPLPGRDLVQGATIDRVKLKLRLSQKPTSSMVSTSNIVMVRLIRLPTNGDAIFVPSNNLDLFLYPAFVASASYALGEVIVPIVANTYKYRCVLAGTVGPSTAGWSTTPGAVFTATGGGTSKWIVENGPLQNDRFHYVNVPYVDTTLGTTANLAETAEIMFNGAVPYDIELVPNRLTTIDSLNYQYFVDVFSPTGCGIIYHSIKVELSGIGSMAVP